MRNTVTATGDALQLAWQESRDAAGKVRPGVVKGWALRRWKADARPAPTRETLPVPSTWTGSDQGLGEKACGGGVFSQGDSHMRCQLLALDDPRDPGGKTSLIFLRSTRVNQDWAWNGRAPSTEFATSSVLWFGEAGRRWLEVLKMNGQAARDLPQTIKGLPGRALKSIGWHLDRPALWPE